MELRYKPVGVCSREIIINYDNNIINNIEVIGGCNGNLKGLSILLQGYDIDNAIKKLDGIKCGYKSTSCPDQIAQALKTISKK